MKHLIIASLIYLLAVCFVSISIYLQYGLIDAFMVLGVSLGFYSFIYATIKGT